MPAKREDKRIYEKEDSEFVKWFSELNKDSGPVAGGKGANLGEIYNLKVPVPEGFVVTAQAYDYFIEKAALKERINSLISELDFENTKKLDETSARIRDMIINAHFPKELEKEILEAYENLSTSNYNLDGGSALDILNVAFEPVFVAVRSSATTEDLADASFAGQQESFLNTKGKEQLIENVKKCFASLFNSRAIYYRNKKGFANEKTSLAVVVQKMINSEKSGVIFSKDPSYKNENIIIEAVWGLGEGIVSGQITPDNYVISRDLKIIDKKIEDKKIAIRRNSAGETKLVQLREDRSASPVLMDYEAIKLADYAIKLEEHYKKPQDIEFAIENNEIYIVQTRAITTIEKRIDKTDKKIDGEIILEGLGASPGIASGKVKIVYEINDLEKIQKGDVLVTTMTNPDMVVTMQKSSAIVTDEGGLTAHAAIVSREMGIPSVVGTRKATTVLKEGEEITVDGYSGKIYKGKKQKTEIKKVEKIDSITKTKIKVIVDLPSFAERASQTGIKKVGLTRIEGIIAESKIHPLSFLKKNKIKNYEEIIFKGVSEIAKYFEEIWVRTSDIRSDEFRNLEGAPEKIEVNPMLGMHVIRFGLKNLPILKAELNALKRVSEKGIKIGVLVPQLISIDELRKVKSIVKELNFKEAKIGVMIETPAAVQIIREICEEKIDFISLGTNDLTQYILAVDRGNPEVQDIYNEMNPAVLHQIEYVIRVCKRNNVETSICGQAGSKKEMVKFLVKAGIDSITVNADIAKEIGEFVHIIEEEIIKGTDKEPRQYEINKEKEKLNKKDPLGIFK